jgi:hypothetical protein
VDIEWTGETGIPPVSPQAGSLPSHVNLVDKHLSIPIFLVPKLPLGNEIVAQALLGHLSGLCPNNQDYHTYILAKQSLAIKGIPKRELGNQG